MSNKSHDIEFLKDMLLHLRKGKVDMVEEIIQDWKDELETDNSQFNDLKGFDFDKAQELVKSADPSIKLPISRSAIVFLRDEEDVDSFLGGTIEDISTVLYMVARQDLVFKKCLLNAYVGLLSIEED
jgi:hypothetical protein